MASRFTQVVQDKRRCAAFHEGAHFSVVNVLPGENIATAFVGQYGGGDTDVQFSAQVTRAHKLLVAVAGFLGEAKGVSKKSLSVERNHARLIAADIDRRLRAGDEAFQVDVQMKDGNTEPGITNRRDFSFLLEDFGSRTKHFKAFFGLDSWANEIQDAIVECATRFENGDLWSAVDAAATELMKTGGITNERAGN